MTETAHTRSRRASLRGLFVQLAAYAALLGLAYAVHSGALASLAWYVLGGVPIWFGAWLIFKQRELAALEAMDLEELRRERRTTGGGEAMFGQEGGGLSYMVAEARLQWMQRWLVPGFGLGTAAYLALVGIWRWSRLGLALHDPRWGTLEQVPLALIALALVMLFLFLFSRYASGMGRVRQWQLLRACGAYMLGNAVAAMAVMVALGVQLYLGSPTWEHALAYVLPALMIVLAVETVLNFILDIYRPRAPGTEPRAAFDSRLLGLIAEPGGIASTIAESLNYQFGFQVSHTWFYQLLQRAFVPLVGVGLLILWLLTSVIVVQPYQRAIVERFGRQINAERPLGPGPHWKLPWPIDTVHKYDTGLLHQITIGQKSGEAQWQPPAASEQPAVELWTDPKHGGFEHFNFLVSPPPKTRGEAAAAAPASLTTRPSEGSAKASPVNILRMHVAIQYKILESKLASYTQQLTTPDDLLRAIAWEEVTRFDSSTYADKLLGEQREVAGKIIEQRIAKRLKDQDLGLELVYVGVQGIHPERTVAEAFRKVVTAEQEKLAAIRKARVTENETLTRVAGDRAKALALGKAITQVNQAEIPLNQAETALRAMNENARQAALERLDAVKPAVQAKIAAQWQLDDAQDELAFVREQHELGLGRSTREVEDAAQRVSDAQAAAQRAAAALEQALTPVRQQLAGTLKTDAVADLIRYTESRAAYDFWNNRRGELLASLDGGAAAVVLANAQAQRWAKETKATGEVARLINVRDAYRAAPEVYKARRYLEALVNGIRNARKYILAFDPGERTVRIRLETQDQARPDIGETPLPKQ